MLNCFYFEIIKFSLAPCTTTTTTTTTTSKIIGNFKILKYFFIGLINKHHAQQRLQQVYKIKKNLIFGLYFTISVQKAPCTTTTTTTTTTSKLLIFNIFDYKN